MHILYKKLQHPSAVINHALEIIYISFTSILVDSASGQRVSILVRRFYLIYILGSMSFRKTIRIKYQFEQLGDAHGCALWWITLLLGQQFSYYRLWAERCFKVTLIQLGFMSFCGSHFEFCWVIFIMTD